MGRYAVCKRCADLVFSVILLVLLALPMGLIALSVALTSRGGILFRQVRVGRGEEPFVCYKFRTMRKDAPKNCPSSSMRDRDRWLTPVGRFLRQTSLDELPQLFNVLKGNMSLVGPRPLIPCEERVHELRRRYGVDRIRPGITGLAQVCGRDELDDRKKAAMDARYLRHMGFSEDTKILCLTLLRVVKRKGVRE
ncbi:MAG: sugar transferase [Clostridia bacterium]|nr:sugar transferase [Clostridia bacterium]